MRGAQKGVKRPVQSVDDLRFTPCPPGAPLASLKRDIRARLVATGVSQQEIADRTGYSQKHVCTVLNGGVVGSWQFLEKIADAAGLEIVVTVREKSDEREDHSTVHP